MRTIPDPAVRMQTLQDAWSAWMRRNRQQAMQWRDSSEQLTAAERERLAATAP
jgi:hypothetical protein